MFTKPKSNSALDAVIAQVLEEMQSLMVDTPEFARATEQLTKLMELREKSSRKPVSSDTLAVVGGNLAGIVLILSHERAHVIGSKALQFVLKLK